MPNFLDMVQCVSCHGYFVPQMHESEFWGVIFANACSTCIEAAPAHTVIEGVAGKLLDVKT